MVNVSPGLDDFMDEEPLFRYATAKSYLFIHLLYLFFIIFVHSFILIYRELTEVQKPRPVLSCMISSRPLSRDYLLIKMAKEKRQKTETTKMITHMVRVLPHKSQQKYARVYKSDECWGSGKSESPWDCRMAIASRTESTIASHKSVYERERECFAWTGLMVIQWQLNMTFYSRQLSSYLAISFAIDPTG